MLLTTFHTFKDYATWWINDYYSQDESSISYILKLFDKNIFPEIGSYQIISISEDMLKELKVNVSINIGAGKAYTVLCILKNIFQHMKRHGLINEDPSANIAIHRPPYVPPKQYSEKDFHTILSTTE